MPDPNNLVLGRGRLYFDRFQTGTLVKTGELYLGATPNFAVNVTSQNLDHYSAEEGLRIKDESVQTQVDYAGTFATEHISFDNLAMFFLGSASTLSQASATGVAETFTVKKGRYYQLGSTNAKPEGVEQVSGVVVTGPSGTPVYVAGTDYDVDLDLGRIEILRAGAIAEDSLIGVTYDVAAATQDRMLSGTSLVQGALRFISYNGVGGQKNFYMPKVTLRPNGDYALKGEEWQQLGFQLEILQAGNLAQLFVSGRAVV